MTAKDKILDELSLYPDYPNMDPALVAVLVEDAILDIKAYINLDATDDLPAACTRFAKDLALRRYNRLGAEGIASTGQSGISESYEADIPPEMRRQLNRIRKLPRR